MRIPIAAEGFWFPDGTYVTEFAFAWSEEPIPVMQYGMVIGYATNLEREGNAIWADVDQIDELPSAAHVLVGNLVMQGPILEWATINRVTIS